MDNISTIAKTINAYLGLVFKIGIVAIILSAFFLFSNTFTEIYDTPKFLVLFGFTALLLILLALRFTVTGKVVFVRSPLDIPLLLLLAVAIVSTFLAPAQYVSLLGNQLRINGSLISIIAFVFFYIILINNLKNAREIKWILNLAIFASQVLAAAALLVYAGVRILPPPLSHGVNFTPTGSSFSTTAILTLLLPFIVLRILSSTKPLFILLNSLFLLILGLAIALTGSLPVWIGALVGLGITFVVAAPLKNIRLLSPIRLIGLIVPLVVVLLVMVLSFIPPIGKAQNPLYTKAQNFPREIQLGFVASWKVSVSAFRDNPFWGSGPSTYLFDFTNYKPAEFNGTKFWNLRFDSAFNEYLQVLATLGGIGILALISLTALFVSAAWKTISQSKHLEGANQVAAGAHLPGERIALAISGIVFFIILLLHPATLPLWVIGLLILAAFMKINLAESPAKSVSTPSDLKNMFLRIAANVTSQGSAEETIRVDALPGVLLVAILALVGFSVIFGSKLVLADYHHRLALNAVAQNNGILAYNELVKAENLNPKNDVYRTDLAQTNFALANAIAAAKGPTEASPSGSLTDQDKQNIQVLLQQSINEGRTAVTLSPKSAVNWEILATLYRQISGVAQNALIFALDSYGRAIFQDPLNPNLRLNVGGVYYAIRNYDMAIRFFSDAVNIKPDFANGYFNLSVALRDKGDLQGAQAAAEKTISLIDASSPDYKPLSDYISDLKNRIASGSAQESQIQPPAAQSTGALQKEELPKLPVKGMEQKPEKIATPEAIKASPTPSPSPSPTQQP